MGTEYFGLKEASRAGLRRSPSGQRTRETLRNNGGIKIIQRGAN